MITNNYPTWGKTKRINRETSDKKIGATTQKSLSELKLCKTIIYLLLIWVTHASSAVDSFDLDTLIFTIIASQKITLNMIVFKQDITNNYQ